MEGEIRDTVPLFGAGFTDHPASRMQGGFMSVKVIIRVLILIILFHSGCFEYAVRTTYDEWEPIYLYIDFRDLNKERVSITVNTNGEKYEVTVKAGQCASSIVYNLITEYLRNNNIRGDYDLKYAIYYICKYIKCSSNDPNKLYIGEKISVELPDSLVIYKLKTRKRCYGYDNLKNIINNIIFLSKYEPNLWDCSNMSALLGYYLFKEGWGVKIAVTKDHAFLLVKTSEEGDWTAIEATSLSIKTERISGVIAIFDLMDKLKRNNSEYTWTHLSQPLMARRIK